MLIDQRIGKRHFDGRSMEPLAKGDTMLKFSNDETSSQSHARSDHPGHMNAVNPRKTTMLKNSSILMLIAASALATTALVPTSASARGFGGGGGFHAAPASPRIANTSFNRSSTFKTATVKTAPVQTGNARSFTRSTVQTGNFH